MMIISLSPQCRPDALTVVKTGDVLTINGADYSFADLPPGATIKHGDVPCDWIAGPVDRDAAGVLHVTLLLPFSADPEPWQAFPDPILDPPDGLLDLPTDTVITVTLEAAEGGINIVTTTRRWRQADDVSVEFVPDAPEPTIEPEPEETDHVDA